MHSVWIAIAVVLLSRLIYELYAEFQFRRLQKRCDCSSPKYEPSIPFGIPALVKFMVSYYQDDFHPATQRQYRDHGALTFREQSVGRTLINTIDPENIKTVLATKFEDFDLGSRHDQFQPLMGEGIFTTSGPKWLVARALLKPQFSTQRVSQLSRLDEHCDNLIARIEEKKGIVDVQELFFMLTLDTATEFLFGESTGRLSHGRTLTAERERAADEFAESFKIAQRILLYRSVADDAHWLVGGSQYRQVTKKCHEFVDYYIEQAQQASEDANYVFLKELIKKTDDLQEIRDQALNILLAGRDTTAALLSFTFALLLRHKNVWTRLRAQVLEHFGTSTDTISFHTLKECKYLQHVLSEVLRLYPPVPINSRQATKDTFLPRGGGACENEPIFVPKSTVVQYHAYSLHRHPRFWGDDADQFRPERWTQLRSCEVAWKFIPFNGGPRICIGQQFALTEAAYVVVRLCQKYVDIVPMDKLGEIKQRAALTSSVAGGVNIKFCEVARDV